MNCDSITPSSCSYQAEKPLRNEKTIFGYKAFHKDWTGHNRFQFRVGETYEENKIPFVGKSGFHFCEQLAALRYNWCLVPETIIALVEAQGTIDHDFDTSSTNKIRIVRQLSTDEINRIDSYWTNIFGKSYRFRGFEIEASWI